jgi:hypothetical protein
MNFKYNSTEYIRWSYEQFKVIERHLANASVWVTTPSTNQAGLVSLGMAEGVICETINRIKDEIEPEILTEESENERTGT